MQNSVNVKTTTLFIFFLACCSGFLKGETYIERVEKLKKTESKVDLYGKIIDQDGRPVVGATVKYEIARYGFLKPHRTRREVVSDKDGLVEVHADKGGLLYIKNIECTGYEYKILYAPGKENETSLEFRRNYRDRHHADKDNPIVWHLRRKDHEGTYILKSGMSVELSMGEMKGRDEKRYGRDFAEGLYYSIDRQPNHWEMERAFWDIEATGEADTEKGIWNVTLKTNGENSGIQRLDTLLYETPADGYQKELSLTIPFGRERFQHGGDEKPLSISHFYARLREPGMYARLDVEEISANEKELLIYCKVLINPYGERSLEKLTFLWQKLSNSEKNMANDKLKAKINKSLRLESDNCENQAIQAMREQRLAERPPFEEWIKEGLAFW